MKLSPEELRAVADLLRETEEVEVFLQPEQQDRVMKNALAATEEEYEEE